MPYSIERRTNPTPEHLVISRAMKILAAPRAYHAVSQNCEHTVHEVLDGEPTSPQLASVLIIGAMAACFALAFKAS